MHINAVHPSSPNSSLSEDDAAVKIQANWKGYRVRKQMKNTRNKSKSNQQNGSIRRKSNGDQTIENFSATKIQAAYKSFKVRKELKNAKEAATKIQAAYKGFRTRKEMKSKFNKDGYSKESQ